MILPIPEQYRYHFNRNVVHVRYYRDDCILLMNDRERELYEEDLETSRGTLEDEIIRFLLLSIITLEIEDDAIELYPGAAACLKENERRFVKTEDGIVVF